jgi:hypothetical protein
MIVTRIAPPEAVFAFEPVREHWLITLGVLPMSRARHAARIAEHAAKLGAGATRHLPSGRVYTDFSNSERDGPFVEQVGDYEVFIEADARFFAGVEHPLKLRLLDAVTARLSAP